MAERKIVRRPRERHQLPTGRHGLSPQFVAAHQRERILSAVADVCSAAGYSAMSVEDIVVTSGVSRKTFYVHYRGKEDVFLAAYDEMSYRLLERVKAAYDAAEGLVGRARESLRALLEFVADEQALADMGIVEALAAGPKAIERRNAIMHAFAGMIDKAAAAELPVSKRPSPVVAETLIGGIYEVIYSRVLTGRYEEVPTLLPDLLYALVLPYVGAGAAEHILEKERGRIQADATESASAA